MDKIPFEDGKKIKNATVTINEQEYEVTPAQYTGTTPMSAFNLNKMQDNIEKAIPITNTIKVSATEPSPKADVWIQHSKNMFKTLPNTTTVNGITFTNNRDGTITVKGTATNVAYIVLGTFTFDNNSYALSGCPEGGGDDKYSIYIIDTSNYSNIGRDFGEGVVFNANGKTGEVRLRVANGVTVNNLVFKPQLERNTEISSFKKYEEPDILVNDNGVYNSVLTKEITTGTEVKTNKRIDGKDIYYKRIDLGTGPNTTSKAYSIGINFNNIVDANVFAKGSAASLKLPFLAQDAQEFINYYFQSTNIVIQAGKDRSGYNFYLEIYYIKQ